MYVSYTPAYVQKFICDISLEPAALGKKTPQKQVYILAMVYIYHSHVHDLSLLQLYIWKI